MGIDQLVNAYKGNPAPLQAKVQQAQQNQPPGAIPPDLEEAIALQKITELRNSAQAQQAMQAGGAQPSIVEKLRQMLSAEQRQQAQPPQMPQMPQGPQGGPPQGAEGQPPQGAPQPPQPPQGQPPAMAASGGSIADLMSNVGRHYAEGGIIGNVRHFEEGGKTSIAGDFFRSLIDSIGSGIQRTADYGKARSEREEAIPGLFEALTPEEREKRHREAKEATKRMIDVRETGGARTPYPEAGKPIPGPWDRPSGQADDDREVSKFIRQTPGMIEAMYKANQETAAPARVNANAGTGSGGGGGGSTTSNAPQNLTFTPSAGGGRDYERKLLARDEDALAGELRAKFLNEVGKKDVSIYDEMAAELKARKERLKGPEKGFDSLMEYLGQIAQSGGGRNWMEAGVKGAAGLSALQKSRQDQQDALVDKILDLGAKKKEAEYGERLSLFNLTKAEKDKIILEKKAVAQSLGLSEDEERKLIQQSLENELNRKAQIRAASVGRSDNLMERAAAIRAENKGMTVEESIKRAALAGGAASVLGTETKDKQKGMEEYRKLVESYKYNTTGNSDFAKKNREAFARDLAVLQATYGPLDIPGINTLPGANPSGKVPPVGTIMEGYKFKGGNPNDKNNWEKV